jgi:hypothetical protein
MPKASWREVTRTCEGCQSDFDPKGRYQRFCSQGCVSTSRKGTPRRRLEDKICETCGESYRRASPNSRYCSRTCYVGAARHRYEHVSGYVAVYAPNEPGANRSNGLIAEHRLVMQQYLGRALRPDESVHHINGVKSDNRIQNLQLRVGQHGKGIAIACYACGSQNVGPVELGGD